ncbi:hypothetical protein JG676_07530 [Campylobacter sp. 2018MI35]|uniref:acylneuraminate cytidylyltransferase family protein n=1 Tax=Campylobacter sp. 2018MI34 TaxID=2800582 RepID=UPI001908C994|nr:hypothetical protein [Campylobacter sp. 2018MI34]MBK1992437.1 hypothetical protein [Campylobacter sp. 2018MI34]
MKTVAFIPIKLNNERIPGKNLKKFYDGTPLIYFVQNTLLQCNNIDEIYVFCSDETVCPFLLDRIKFLKRDKKLDTKETLCGDLISAFIKQINADIYIMAHATLPFVQVETYKKCIEAVQSGKYTSAMPMDKIQNLVWFQNKPLNFEIDYIPRTQDMIPVFSEISSPCVFKKEIFEKFGGRVGDNHYIYEGNKIEAIDIDYPEDFEFANIIYKYLIKKDIH